MTSEPATGSYRRIFKSTALIGGTSVVSLLIRMVQTKVLAVLLGPGGTGLAGSYVSTTSLIGVATGMGIGLGGVRQIAEASGTGDEERIARAVITLRRTSVVCGLAGMLIVLVFCRPLSWATFGNYDQAAALMLVSLTLLFGEIAAGQNALLQGLRRLRHLAISQVLGLGFGAVAAIACVALLGQKGIALFLVASSAFGVLLSWWFARKVTVARIRVTWLESVLEARILMVVGFSFVAAGVLSSGVDYLTRVWIIRELGIDTVGLYQATWTLGAYYVTFVTGAMAADFFPRLTSISRDNAAVNRLVNEQVEIGLLLALPGVLATMVLAPLVLRALYSSAFVAAAEVIRWQSFGVLLRVVGWPLGMVLQAKGKPGLFLCCETAFYVVAIPLYWLGIHFAGLVGWGGAFSLVYLLYLCGMTVVCRSLTGFAWSKPGWAVLLPSFLACAAMFLLICLVPTLWAMSVGMVLVCLVTVHNLREVQNLLGINIVQWARKRFSFLREAN